MLAIAGQLCTLWEIMGGVQRGGRGCAWGHVPHQHIAPLSGQEAAFPAMSPSSSTLCHLALAFLLQVKLMER